jgi:hypothetical protein
MRSKITFVGDFYLPEPGEVQGVMPENVVLNLEAPITSATIGWPGKVNLKTEQSPFASSLRQRVLGVCLANNHVMDYGEAGLEDTFRALKQYGMPFYGAGHHTDNCHNPLMVEFAGLKLAFLGYVCPTTHPVFYSPSRPGVVPIDRERIRSEVEQVRRHGAERVVVSLHWGEEEVFQPKPADVVIARHVVEAGADMVVGHHSHCIQPWEQWQGKYIFYGLGNAHFPDLSVPAMFDNSGHPTVRYMKRQHSWNRQALGVVWEPRNSTILVQQMSTKRNRYIWHKPINPPGRLRLRPNKAHATVYQRSVAWSRLRGMLFAWLDNPRFPRIHHLKALWSPLAGHGLD